TGETRLRFWALAGQPPAVVPTNRKQAVPRSRNRGTNYPRSANGSYTNELIHARRWNDVVEVEIATFEWVSWWNETRLHQSLGYRTPVEVETEFWKQNPPQVKIEIKANA
ncbi:integrase core domain-containing protein, partial [Corynebacterium striatum]